MIIHQCQTINNKSIFYKSMCAWYVFSICAVGLDASSCGIWSRRTTRATSFSSSIAIRKGEPACDILSSHVIVVQPGASLLMEPNPHFPIYLCRLFDLIIMNALAYRHQ